MAKKVQAAEIVIKTTDGGSFKIFGQQVDKATKKTEKMGRAAQNTDRNIKGVTKQSANSTKEFSKMATMQGGLVAVYATLAAQVFAVSAAFQFLKSSMETRNLIAAQEAFGAITGTAYRTLTKDIQNATNSMLDFKTAASGAAIGIASGLNASQLKALGKAATDASLALGRDLTDSFNRLIRGVTKAEPELLDELGIVLRLENATTKYAVAVGKARTELNAYERTQAVLNDVLDQAETKFAAVQEIMDPDAFALGQFQKEFDDLLMGFQKMVIEVVIPAFKFFKDNSIAFLAAIGLFVAPIVRSLLPDLAASAETNSKAATDAFNRMKTAASDAKAEFGSVRDNFGRSMPSQADSKEALKGMGVKKFSGDGGETLSKRQIAAYRRALREKNGIYKKMNAAQRREFRFHLAAQEAMQKKGTMKQVQIVKTGESLKQAAIKGTVAVYQAGMATMTKVTSMGARAMNLAFSAAGIIGIVAMLYSLGEQLYRFFFPISEEAKRMKEETEATTDRVGDLADELLKMKEVRESGLVDLAQQITQTGNALSSTDLANHLASYNAELKKGALKGKDNPLRKSFVSVAESLQYLAPEMKGLADAMDEQKELTPEVINEFVNLAAGYQNASTAAAQFQANQDNLNKTLDKTVSKFKKMPYQDLRSAFNTSIEGIEAQLGGEYYDGPGKNFGMAEQRAANAAARAKASQEEMDAITANITRGQGRNKRSFKMTNEDGSLMDRATFESQSTYYRSSAAHERLMEEFDERMQMQEKFVEEEQKRAEQAADEIAKEKVLKDLHREQTAIRAQVILLQDAGLKNATDTLTTNENLAQTLAEQVGETKEINRIKFERQALDNAEGKAAVDVQAAELNRLSTAEKLRTTMLNSNKVKESGLYTEDQLNKMTEAELVLAAKGLTIDTQAYDTADSYVGIAEQTLRILEYQNKVKREQLDIDQKLANLRPTEEELRLQLEILKRTQGEEKKAEKIRFDQGIGEFAGLGLGGDQALLRSQKRGRIDTLMGKNSSIIENLKSQRTDLGADTTAENYDATTGMFTGNLSQTQKEHNELVKQLNVLQAENIKLQQEKKVLGDDYLKNVAQKELDIEQMKLEFMQNRIMSLNPAAAEFNKFIAEQAEKGVYYEGEKLEALKAQFVEMQNLKIEQELMSGIQETLSNGFVNMFQAMIDGTQSFSESMKKLTAQVLADLAAMFVKAAALKAMMALFPGMGGGGSISSMLGFGSGDRYGGERFRGSYMVGGVADGPESGYMAKLHGREAIVPLGNDRSIPVEMKGGGEGNTVNVSISVQGNGQSAMSSNGGGALEGMGRQIGALVQQHLQQEMRPGGILNSQGNRSR